MWPKNVVLTFVFHFLLYFCGTPSLANNNFRQPKIFRVDLDTPPRERWHHVLEEYKDDVIPRIAGMAKSYVPRRLRSLVFGIFGRLTTFLPKEYGEELRGMADYLSGTGITLGELVALNVLYDLTDFAHSPSSNPGNNSTEQKPSLFPPLLGCTSIVAAQEDGRILHGRNLDYGMTELLRDATILVDFVKGGKIKYTSISFVTSVGILTGQKPGQFTVSLNARYSGGALDNVLMELLTRFHHPVAFELRRVLEGAGDYVEALGQLSRVHMIAPSYIILGGKRGDGAIITRNRLGAADVYLLDYLHGRWFLLETNFDHWKRAGDKRRKYGRKYMRRMGQSNLSANALFRDVLAKSPIWVNETVYSTIMSAEEPPLIYNHTAIWG